MNNLPIGTIVAFEDVLTRRLLPGSITSSQGGLVKIRTADGKWHTRLAERVKMISYQPETPDISETPNIQSRFELMRLTVAMVANGDTASAIISGPGGLGKTYLVRETLADLGLVKDVDYMFVKGFTSARGLYETLYKNNGMLTVFDDCDSALKDRTSASLLKGALDSYSVRDISWLVKASTMDATIPLNFEFDGRIIFITNKLIHELDSPLRTRSLVIDLQMTQQEILTRMEQILPHLDGFEMANKLEAMRFIRTIAPAVRQLSIRTILLVLKIMKAHPNNWRDLAKYTITQ